MLHNHLSTLFFAKAVRFKSFLPRSYQRPPFNNYKNVRASGEGFEDKSNPHESPQLPKKQSRSCLNSNPKSRLERVIVHSAPRILLSPKQYGTLHFRGKNQSRNPCRNSSFPRGNQQGISENLHIRWHRARRRPWHILQHQHYVEKLLPHRKVPQKKPHIRRVESRRKPRRQARRLNHRIL